MADADVDADSRPCERVESVQVDNDGVNDDVNDGVNDSVNDGVNDSVTDGVNDSVNDSINDSVNDSVSENVNEDVNENVNTGSNEEWVYVNWAGRGTEWDNSVPGEQNCIVATEMYTREDDTLTPPVQNYDSAVNEDNGLLRTQSEESDDISVITESEMEVDPAEDVLSVTFNGFYQFEGKMCGPLRMLEGSPKRSLQGGVLLNLIIACSLGVIIGFAAGKIFFVADTCSISGGIDIEMMKTESDNLVNRMKELNEIKRILDQIKESIPPHRKISRYHVKKLVKDSRFTQPVKILDVNSFHSTSTTLNQLQVSLNTLSSTINEIDNVDVMYTLGVNKTKNILLDLSMFQDVMINLVERMQNLDKPVEARFLQGANDKIRRVSELLLSELLETVYDLTINVYNKFDNVRYKLNKQLCCLKSTMPKSENFLTELYENNIFLNSCEKILDIRCNFSPESNGKPRRKRQSGKTKQEKRNAKRWKASQAKTTEVAADLNAAENELAVTNKDFCSTNRSINPTIIGPLLPEDICSTQQERSLYSETVAAEIRPHIPNKNISDEQNDSLSRNPDAVTTGTRKSSNRNNTGTPSLECSQTDGAGANKSQETFPMTRKKEEANVKTPPSINSIVEFLNSFNEVPEDNLNHVRKKKKKSYPSVASDKKSRNKSKGSGRNYTKKDKRGQKNGPRKYSKIDFSSTFGAQRPKEKNQQRYIDGDWQFKRSRSRERQRRSDMENTEDSSNWYFDRARSRKNSRDREDFNEELRKLRPNCFDWAISSEEDVIDDWFEKKKLDP